MAHTPSVSAYLESGPSGLYVIGAVAAMALLFALAVWALSGGGEP